MPSEQLFYDKKTGFDRLTDEDKQHLKEALDNASELYYKGAIRMFRFLQTGMQMNRH